ncbi:quercetin dioxygenase-like cupin family protein [Acetoanaerobium pronyense]|uniref:Quercetin dioxygenase-like cupin family protein n=1 Tax=Acetoanaerobium pronyense TaxID=1482736 RepID=A0ABS4KQ46_9FIRM|nr:quercetin dioxygenase-like cupin family protein [Acetoanaerobium pronyense]
MENQKFINHMPMGEVFKMAEQIDYEENKVASITLVKQSNLIVTLFSLYEGEEIGGHSSTGDAMVYILDGVAEITIGEDVHTVSKGEHIIMPANIRHALKAAKSFKMLLTVVKPS